MQHCELFLRQHPKDLFQNWPTEYERRESVIQVRNREMRKINLLLDMDIKPIPAKEIRS